MSRGLKKGCLYSVVLWLAVISRVTASTYWVAPGGDDANDGLTQSTAWLSLDNGDVTGVLGPGDTVYVLPGTYTPAATYDLTTDGTGAAPIVYRRYGVETVVINGSNASGTVVQLNGMNTKICGFRILNAKDDAIQIKADSNVVSDLLIADAGKRGIRIEASYCTILRNTIARTGDRGIENESSGAFNNVFYHNTVAYCNNHAIELHGTTTARLFNNNVCYNSGTGIKVDAVNIIGYNNLFGNSPDLDGVADSAGGISKNPRFINPAENKFDLDANSLLINAGLDLGYSYSGSAPEIGAYEKAGVYYVSPTGDDTNDGLSPVKAWRTIDNGVHVTRPGDTVRILAGTYTEPVIIADSGLFDEHITYLGVADSTIIDGSGEVQAVSIIGEHLTISGLTIRDALNDNLVIDGPHNDITGCTFTGAGQYGLRVEAGKYNLVFRSVFAENTLSSILLGDDSSQVVHNTFYDIGPYGINAGTHLRPVIRNNVFVSAVGTNTAIRATSTSVIEYCCFYNYDANVEGGGSAKTGSIAADPLLIDPAGGVFRLSSFSPAIDAGTDLGYPFSGNDPDMGAFETGVAATLDISPAPDTLLADSSYQFTAIALDANGWPAAPGTLAWSHTFATGTIDAEGLFTPNLVGTGQIEVASNIGGLTASTPVLEVVPGGLATLTIAPAADTVSADFTQQFIAGGTDVNGNVVGDLGTLEWSVIGDIGTIDSSGLFTAGTTGKGFVEVASTIGASAKSDTILVVPGAFVDLMVVPQQTVVEVGGTQDFVAYGLDADSNITKDLTDSVSWSTSDVLGGIAAGTYSPGVVPGSYNIYADYVGQADTAEVTTTLGALDHIRIELADGTPLGDTILSTDVDTTMLYCRGYDAGNGLLGDVSVSWSYTTSDTIGTLLPGPNTSTRLTLTTPGTAQVVATHSGGLVDTSGTITCQSGRPELLQASPESVAVTADSTVNFTAVSLDADGNPSTPGIVPSWSVIGSIGTITSGGQFNPTTVGTGFVVASGGPLADTVGPVIVTAGGLATIEVHPDTAVVAADMDRQFTVTGYDSEGNQQSVGTITWSLLDPLGTIDAGGLFTPGSLGETRVIAESSNGPVDTTSILEIVAGRLVQLTISPDSTTIAADQTEMFTALGNDALGNEASVGFLTWTSLDGFGDLSSDGMYTPVATGVDRVVVTSSIDGVSDTNTAVIVVPGDLSRLVINPDTATLGVGETQQFTVSGFDEMFNPVVADSITWSVAGGIGTIDDSGLFTAVSPGTGAVIALSPEGVADTSGSVLVEGLRAAVVPLGSAVTYPGASLVPVLAFDLQNPLMTSKSITAVSIRPAPRGAGTLNQIIGAIDSLVLYRDSDADLVLTAGDTRLGMTLPDPVRSTFTFAPLAVGPDSVATLIAGLYLSDVAHDGDSLDYVLLPAADIEISDSTYVAGPDTANSLGFVVIDGMVADQIALQILASDTIAPAEQMLALAAVDIPKNGYLADTLDEFSIRNYGTSTENDFDSVVLYADNGNGVWGGSVEETRLGRMAYTGTQWTRSGIGAPIADASRRFFIAADLATYPVDGSTFVLAIPSNGINMRSSNDGPIDGPMIDADTITITTNEQLAVTSGAIKGRSVYPGANSGPLLGISLNNEYAAARTLDSLRVRFSSPDNSVGPNVLASQIDSVGLYLVSGSDAGNLSDSDSLLTTVSLVNSEAVFGDIGLMCPGAGTTRHLAVVAFVSLTEAKNGNSIAFEVVGASDFTFSPATVATADFPLANSEKFTIDAFPAAAVTVAPLSDDNIFGGQLRVLAMDMILPGNGYAADTVAALNIRNLGTLDDASALTSVRLYVDRTGDGFTGDDPLAGGFVYNAQTDVWSLPSLSFPTTANGSRVFVTINVATDRFEGGTLEFAIPIGGLLYRSGMIGPDLAPVLNNGSLLVVPSNRVTVISIPGNATTAAPGEEQVGLLTFALYNGFLDQTRTLSAVTLTNSTRTRSSLDFADAECGQVSLYLDTDGSRSFNGDSLLGSGYFSDQQLTLTGLDVVLPAESLSYFFVVADIPETVIDSDSLAVAVMSATDMSFTEPANLNGDLPLLSNSYAVIDGSVKRQYALVPIQPRTLSPGDTSIPFLGFRPAVNGDLADTLEAVTFVNLETADGSDLVGLELWADSNDDNLWQATDQDIGTFVYAAGQWTASGLSLPVVDSAPALFVTGDVAIGATPNASFRPAIPTNGVQYYSANDGPIDSGLVSGASFVISSSGLRITYQGMSPSYSVGQTVEVRFTAENLLTGDLSAVTGEVVMISDSSLVTLDSAEAGPLTLASGARADFVYYYTVAAAGSIYWQLQCVAGIPIDSSAVVTTGSIDLQTVPSLATAQLINTIPTSVTRGQQNVFPLSLRLTHGDIASTAAAIRLESLSLDIETGDGTAQSAADVFSRLVLATGYTNLVIMETIPDQSRLDLVFSQPVLLTAGNSLQFTLLTDIADSAQASDFVVAISSAVSIPAVDDNTLQAIPIQPAATFPLKTASCRIDDPSDQLAVANVSPAVAAVNIGQDDVTMLTLGLRHPGVTGSSQIQLSGLSLRVVSGAGDTLSPVDVIERIRVMNQQTQLGEVWWSQFGASRIDIQLAAPLTLAPGEEQTINIRAAIADQTLAESVSLVVPDSLQFVIRDLSSGSVVDAVTDKDVLATGSVFPVASTIATIKQPAVDPLVCAESILPVSLVGGIDSLPLFRFTVTYPADSTVSSAAWESVVLTTLDSLARPLDPDRLFDRIGCRVNGVTTYQSFVELFGGGVRFNLGAGGIPLTPGDSLEIELLADIESDVPYDHFVTVIQNQGALALRDVTDTSHHPSIALQGACSGFFPLEAGPATVFLPAGRPNVAVVSEPVKITYPGQVQVPIAQFNLAYAPPSLQGDIAVTGLTGRLTRRTETGRISFETAALFDQVELRIGDDVVAVDSSLIGDSLVLVIPDGYVMNRGESNPVTLVADIGSTPAPGNYQVVFDDSLFLAMEDNNLTTTVFPSLSAATYPQLGTELSLSSGSLKESFSNYPNPFVASRGDGTRLAFVMPEDGYVDIEIFTVTGERVTTLVTNDLRAAGSHQDLIWYGRNDTGLDIAPGTYFCRIIARFVSGRTEEVRRKIAVLR